MRVVVFGMSCAASAPTLAALLAARVDVAALVLAADGAPTSPSAFGRGSGFEPSPPERMAAAAGVPVWPVRRIDAALVAAVRALRPDALAVACFPRRLPPDLLAVAPLGAFNVHPSLLPRNRGPEPVFWTLRRGERVTGTTVHRLDAGFDTGPIVAQARRPVPPGVRAPDLERDLMALGGRLLVEALPALAAGRLTPRPQDDALATTAPPPAAADWLALTNLPAAWAYAFVRGVAPLAWAVGFGPARVTAGPLAVAVGALGQTIPVHDALDHDPIGRLDAPLVDEGNGVIRVRFRPGWVRFATTAAARPCSHADG